MVSQPDVNASGLAVVPQTWPAIESGVAHLLLPGDPQLVGRAQVGRDAIAVQGDQGIREMAQRKGPLVLDSPHGLPGRRKELMRHLAFVGVWIASCRNELP